MLPNLPRQVELPSESVPASDMTSSIGGKTGIAGEDGEFED
jgi:hypothetical protein